MVSIVKNNSLNQALKKIYRAFKKEALSAKSNLYIWCEFFSTIAHSRSQASIILYHIEPWQVGWDLDERRKFYIQLLSRRKVLVINLRSKLQVSIANWILSTSSVDGDTLDCREILFRGLWDEVIRNVSPKASSLKSSSDYLRLYDGVVKKETNNKTHLIVQNLIKSKKISSLVLMQEAYYELWLAVIGAKYEKILIYPETELGFIRGELLSIRRRKELYLKIFNKLTKKHIEEATDSLSNRTNGDYKKSTLGNYVYAPISKIPFKLENEVNDFKNILIYFMHSFTDSPNYSVSSLKEFIYIDHYAFLLEFLRVTKLHPKSLVLLRFHPHGHSYQGDVKYEQQIRELVDGIDNVKMVSSDVPLVSLRNAFGKKLKALTGFGSVAQECAFLNIPIYSYKKNIYTEIGISKYIENINVLFSDDAFSMDGLSEIAINIEAARIYSLKYNIFVLDNYRKESRNRFLEMIDLEEGV